MVSLPVDSFLPEITSTLAAAGALVLVAEPGAGKTTRVPPAILRSRMLGDSAPQIVMLQPRRIAARAAAERIAEENGWPVGGEVGYHVRFEKRVGRDTKIRVVTEGLLTRQLLDDPELSGVGCVILDEFHERSIHADLALALLNEVRGALRDDLKILVMSATLDAEPIAKFLGGCPIVRVPGRTYPVEIVHQSNDGSALEVRVRRAVQAAMSDERRATSGNASTTHSSLASDVLVFLPGAEEIRWCERELTPLARENEWTVLPLHGSLPFEEQRRALARLPRRKIVLATNIAETSLTIDGVTTVIDAGLARVPSFDANRGLETLEVVPISRASAQQRAGRAGRTRAGVCVRLWSVQDDRTRSAFELPEMHRTDLSATVLALHAWGLGAARQFQWFDPPGESAVAAAERLLTLLGALDENGRITALGKAMHRLPTHPRLARLLIEARRVGADVTGATVAALLGEKDVLRRTRVDRFALGNDRVSGTSDLTIRLDALADAERVGFDPRRCGEEIDAAAARQVARVRDELLRATRGQDARTRSRLVIPDNAHRQDAHETRRDDPREMRRDDMRETSGDDVRSTSGSSAFRAGHDAARPVNEPRAMARVLDDPDALLRRLVLLAYPDRVCRRRSSDPNAAAMVGGGGVRLDEASVVKTGELFVAVDAQQNDRVGQRQALVRIASAIDAAWLTEFFTQSVRCENVATLDAGRLAGVRRTYYRDLLLGEDRTGSFDPADGEAALYEHFASRVNDLMDTDETLRGLRVRLSMIERFAPLSRRERSSAANSQTVDKAPRAEPSDAISAPIAGAQRVTTDPRSRVSVDPNPELSSWLASACVGARSIEDVKQNLIRVVRDELPWDVKQRLEQLAPETIVVPTGNRLKLDWSAATAGNEAPTGSSSGEASPARGPVLAVRLQELFGLPDTPRVFNGRVPVVLHLLGPNYRPVQVTNDLASFWKNLYPQVRKELRARYPKHSWPDDPLAAAPQAKGRSMKC